MMTNKAKQQGGKWEHDAVVLLNLKIKESIWKRIPGSGAIGTNLNEPMLTGDLVGIVPSFSKKFKAECKSGYNSSTNKEVKQFTLKKEWLDKISEEAKTNFSIPILLGKFTNARSGVKHFVVLDLNEFSELINYVTDLKKELDLLYERRHT